MAAHKCTMLYVLITEVYSPTVSPIPGSKLLGWRMALYAIIRGARAGTKARTEEFSSGSLLPWWYLPWGISVSKNFGKRLEDRRFVRSWVAVEARVGAALGDSAPGSKRAGKNKKGDWERRGGKVRLLFSFLSFPLSFASLVRETPTHSSRWRQRISLVCENKYQVLYPEMLHESKTEVVLHASVGMIVREKESWNATFS
jgi:hypothetical protein